MKLRCWCHAAMESWLGEAVLSEPPSSEALLRWQAECERAGGDCPARVEAIALRLPTARAQRQGRRLTLYTQAGPLRFEDPADSFVPQHRYLGAVHQGARHLLWRRGHAQPFVLVCVDTGAQHSFTRLDEALAFTRSSAR
jgi:hypothetical protein